MAFLRKRRIGKAVYFYIVENRRRGGKVRQKVLEYLGRDVSTKKVRKALDYWEEALVARRKFGARVYQLDKTTAVVMQTYKVANNRSMEYRIHTMPLSGKPRQRMVANMTDARALGKAVLAALRGELTLDGL